MSEAQETPEAGEPKTPSPHVSPQQDQLKALQNSIYLSIGLTNLPEFHGFPHEDIRKFLKEFGRATSTLNQEQKCLALKKSLVDDARIFLKKYLKQYLSTGQWKAAKEELKRRFSKTEPSLLYRTELKKLVFEPSKSTLLGYIDKYADLYRKVHSNVNENELIQDISLSLGNNIVLKLNQLSANWKSIKDFEVFRDVVSRLERDIIALENEAAYQSTSEMATTVNKLISSALEAPIKGMQEIISQISQKKKEEGEVENLAAIRYGQYPDRSYNRYKQDYNKRRERDWEDYGDKRRFKRDEQGQEPTVGERAKELRQAYEKRFGRVTGVCYYCQGYHFRRHCPLELDLKGSEDRP